MIITTQANGREAAKPFFKNRTLWLGLIFIVSLAFRYQDFYVFREFNADKAHQLQAAYELLQGKGVSLESYDLKTFQPHELPLVAWPPGYSYIVAGLSKLTGLSVYQASWAVDALAIAMLWCILLWLTFMLRFNLLQTALLFLFTGFFRTPWFYLWSADVIGTVFFLLAAAINVYFLQKKEGKANLAAFTLLQFPLIAAMCFLKYSLLPAYVALALSVFSFSMGQQQKHYRTGFALTGAVLVSLGLLILYSKLLSGHATDMVKASQKPKGLYFQNLLMYNAFLVNSFIYMEGLLQRVHLWWAQLSVQLLNGLIVLVLLFQLGKRMAAGKADYFMHLVFWTTVCVCGFLALLSVVYPQETFVGIYFWTYVKELRYFLPVVFLLIVYLIRHFHLRLPRTASSALAFVFVGVAAVFGFALNSYYKLTHNRAASFQNMVGRIERAEKFVRNRQDSNTYFLSMTGNSAVDAQATSLAAISGAKVVISYDGVFPDAYLSPLFSKARPLPHGKKVIIYLNDNLRIADSLNPQLAHHIEQDAEGEKFLLVTP